MAFEYHIHHDLRLIYRKIWGVYGSQDSMAAHQQWDELASEGEVSQYDELSDLTEVTDYGVSIDQIHKLATHYRKLTIEKKESGTFRAKKIAYVIPSPLAYGTGRVYGALIEETGMNFKVFEDLDHGCEWLDLSPETTNHILIRKLT